MATIIDSVKRLERSGAENSRATQKLRDAAEKLAKHCEDLIDDTMCGVSLPRGYVVEGRDGSRYLMSRRVRADDYDGGDFRSAYYEAGVTTPREDLLILAADVAEGWLDELATFFDQRGAESTSAADVITQALERAD